MQIATWDANVITAHRRMGNTGLSLKDLSDGKYLALSLEGSFAISHVVLPEQFQIQLLIY